MKNVLISRIGKGKMNACLCIIVFIQPSWSAWTSTEKHSEKQNVYLISSAQAYEMKVIWSLEKPQTKRPNNSIGYKVFIKIYVLCNVYIWYTLVRVFCVFLRGGSRAGSALWGCRVPLTGPKMHDGHCTWRAAGWSCTSISPRQEPQGRRAMFPGGTEAPQPQDHAAESWTATSKCHHHNSVPGAPQCTLKTVPATAEHSCSKRGRTKRKGGGRRRGWGGWRWWRGVLGLASVSTSSSFSQPTTGET